MFAIEKTARELGLNDLELLRNLAFVNGQWLGADNARTIPVADPATGRELGCVPEMGASETQRAIIAASHSLANWRSRTGKERATILRKWFDLMVANQEDLARIMTAEQGKPLAESRAEIVYAASFIEWFSEEAKRVYGDIIPANVAGRRIVVLKEPIGVTAAITPWNFPAAMITRKAAPALAAGCTMVLKPASATPFSALAIALLAERAGVPAGVFSVVTGSARAIGSEMTSNPLVRKVSFTGSTEVGKVLMAQSATTVKKVSLELGGNAPFIVFDDADLDQAVKGAVESKFRNTGQTCVCTNRILVQDGIYDAFVAKLSLAVSKLAVGPGLGAREVHLGPLIDMSAVEKVEQHIQDAVAKGAQVNAGGKRHHLGGTFFEPTILTGVTGDMMVSKDETFGPLAALFRFQTESEAIELANNTEFGLAAYFYSRDIGRVWRVTQALECGMVGVNEGLISTEVAPFGGIKESGIGREGSKYGIEDYLEIKYACMGGLDLAP